MLLGLSGAAGAGKDTFGYLLRDEYGYKKVAYADRLRTALYTLNPIVVANAEHHGMIPRDYGGPVYRTLQSVIDEYGWEGYKNGPFSGDVRRLIQLMGTEVGRGIAGPDVWIDATSRDINLKQNTVITDVRFPNEAEFVKRYGGYVVHIVRPGVENRAGMHPSETSMSDWKFDFEITNNANTIDEYREHIRAFMKYLPEHDYFMNVIGDM